MVSCWSKRWGKYKNSTQFPGSWLGHIIYNSSRKWFQKPLSRSTNEKVIIVILQISMFCLLACLTTGFLVFEGISLFLGAWKAPRSGYMNLWVRPVTCLEICLTSAIAQTLVSGTTQGRLLVNGMMLGKRGLSAKMPCFCGCSYIKNSGSKTRSLSGSPGLIQAYWLLIVECIGLTLLKCLLCKSGEMDLQMVFAMDIFLMEISNMQLKILILG